MMGAVDPLHRAWRRPALAALAVAALLVVVALASGGSPWSHGSRGSRHLPQSFWDAVWTVVFLLWVVAAGFAVRRLHVARLERGPSSWKDQLKPLLGLALLGLVIALVVTSHHFRRHPRSGAGVRPPVGAHGVGGSLTGLHREGPLHEPHFSLPAALVTVAVLAALAAAAIARRRRRPALTQRQAAAAALAQVLADSLDDLRREPDPRRAVIAAYARMERTLGAYGLGRAESEAPGEYLGRVLGELHASGESARRLTDLFARAKFGSHEIDAAMKDDAIDALVTLRDELQVAA
jgi:hypothetical protein